MAIKINVGVNKKIGLPGEARLLAVTAGPARSQSFCFGWLLINAFASTCPLSLARRNHFRPSRW